MGQVPMRFGRSTPGPPRPGEKLEAPYPKDGQRGWRPIACGQGIAATCPGEAWFQLLRGGKHICYQKLFGFGTKSPELRKTTNQPGGSEAVSVSP